MFAPMLPILVLLAAPASLASPPRLHRGRATGIERAEICAGALQHLCGGASECHACVALRAGELAHAGCIARETVAFCRILTTPPSRPAPMSAALSAAPPCDLPTKWKAFCPQPPVCHCDDPSLCKSLPAGEAGSGWQNIAFYSGEIYGGNGTEWTKFDWNKTTMVGMYDGGYPYDHGKMQCVAHAHKTRIVDWNIASDAFSIFAPGGDRRSPAFLGNATLIDDYTSFLADFVHEAGIDGTCLDIEMEPGSITGPNLTIVREGFTSLTCELKRKLQIKTPGAALVWAMPLMAVAPADGGIYDYAAMAACHTETDFHFVPMAYQAFTGKNAFATGSISPHQLEKGVSSYAAVGIKPTQLIVALPWFGSEFLCNCADPHYPQSSSENPGGDPTHDGGKAICPKAAPWHGICPQGCRLNLNKPTPMGPGPDLGIGQVMQLYKCANSSGQWAEPGPPGPVRTLDKASTTWMLKVPAGNCHALSDDNCGHCCPSCGGVNHSLFTTGGAMTMSKPPNNTACEYFSPLRSICADTSHVPAAEDGALCRPRVFRHGPDVALNLPQTSGWRSSTMIGRRWRSSTPRSRRSASRALASGLRMPRSWTRPSSAACGARYCERVRCERGVSEV
jgi:hypothetical protein